MLCDREKWAGAAVFTSRTVQVPAGWSARDRVPRADDRVGLHHPDGAEQFAGRPHGARDTAELAGVLARQVDRRPGAEDGPVVLVEGQRLRLPQRQGCLSPDVVDRLIGVRRVADHLAAGVDDADRGAGQGGHGSRDCGAQTARSVLATCAQSARSGSWRMATSVAGKSDSSDWPASGTLTTSAAAPADRIASNAAEQDERTCEVSGERRRHEKRGLPSEQPAPSGRRPSRVDRACEVTRDGDGMTGTVISRADANRGVGSVCAGIDAAPATSSWLPSTGRAHRAGALSYPCARVNP